MRIKGLPEETWFYGFVKKKTIFLANFINLERKHFRFGIRRDSRFFDAFFWDNYFAEMRFWGPNHPKMAKYTGEGSLDSTKIELPEDTSNGDCSNFEHFVV